jgi:sporulation protein YlmC with PRC-barrel domain
MTKRNDSRAVEAADALEGGKVVSPRGEDLGFIEEIMIDVPRGRVAYAVMACGSPELAEKRVAVPWKDLTRDAERGCFVLDSDRERLGQAPGLTYR